MLRQLDDLTDKVEDDIICGKVAEIMKNFRTGLGHSISLFQNKIDAGPNQFNSFAAPDSGLPTRRIIKK